ncbi:hypothetical protein CLV40_12454 [Actinokineospora auranticolor]|uniref:Uncharacterized protein n=1 Tax=Actinokineospora auranticolor TaxID=155976 RepID=A0A2S6GF36_9PSEU|nr:hypothetical protein CLV40_12454 [Actinokineospora auranticolor]
MRALTDSMAYGPGRDNRRGYALRPQDLTAADRMPRTDWPFTVDVAGPPGTPRRPLRPVRGRGAHDRFARHTQREGSDSSGLWKSFSPKCVRCVEKALPHLPFVKNSLMARVSSWHRAVLPSGMPMP